MAKSHSLDIGFWFPRPERGATLAQHLRRRGHQVSIYHHLPVPDEPAYVRQVGRRFLPGLRVLRSSSHDVLYTSHAFTPVLQLLANKRLTGQPFVFNSNGPIWGRGGSWSLSRPKAALHPILLRMVVAGADAIVANSRFLADGFRSRYPSLDGKVSTIYNGIDYEKVEAGVPRRSEWPPGQIRILSTVTLQFSRKTEGARLLVDAYEIIGRRHPDVSFLMAAKSDIPAVVASVKDRIAQLRCADRVRLDVNRGDVPDLLASADLFLYATPADSSDSLPRALLEAQAAGIPIVTTTTTGCAEVILDRETGRAVAYDANAIADAASELLSDTDLARRMAERGKQTVRERFSWDTMADEYEKLFLQVVGAAQ